MPSLTIIDTGHGNCAVINDQDVSIVDAPRRAELLQYLDDKGIGVIDNLFLSHADADHIDGAATLLTDDRYTVKNVYLNPEPMRNTDTWNDLVDALGYARRRCSTQVHATLNSFEPGLVSMQSVEFEVLGPSPEMVVGGPKSKVAGQPVTANTNSAVLLVKVNGDPRALLPGDVDDVGLQQMITEGKALSAPILVFPHHGGRPGRGDSAGFTKQLCDLVRPEQIIFSIGRGMHKTPRPEIVAATRASSTAAHLACTQLSKHCDMRASF